MTMAGLSADGRPPRSTRVPARAARSTIGSTNGSVRLGDERRLTIDRLLARAFEAFGGEAAAQLGVGEHPFEALRASPISSPGSKRRPFSPSWTNSGMPPAAPATTATPHACASSTVRPNGSARDALTRTSRFRMTLGTSSVGPVKRARSPRSRATSARTDSSYWCPPTSEAPTITSCASPFGSGQPRHGPGDEVDALLRVDAAEDADDRPVRVRGEPGAHVGVGRTRTEAVDVDTRMHHADPARAPCRTPSVASVARLLAIVSAATRAWNARSRRPSPGTTMSCTSSTDGVPVARPASSTSRFAFNVYDSTMSAPTARMSFATRRASRGDDELARDRADADATATVGSADRDHPRAHMDRRRTGCRPGALEVGAGWARERHRDAGVEQARSEVEELALGAPHLSPQWVTTSTCMPVGHQCQWPWMTGVSVRRGTLLDADGTRPR